MTRPKPVLAGPAVGNAQYQKYLDQGIAFLTDQGEIIGSPAYTQILSLFVGDSRYWRYDMVEVAIDAGRDVLRFGAGIHLEDVQFRQVDTTKDWVIEIHQDGHATADRVILRNWADANSRVERIEFADGSGYALDKIAARTVASALMWGAQPQTQGTPGDDVFLAGRSYYAPSTPVPGFESNGALRPRSTYGAMSGALGDDTYVVTHRSDLVIEKPNEGMDTVRASLSHRLADNVENLQLVGTTAIDGTGNALANVLVGNAADNVLSGEAGDDTLTGGRGNDVLRGGSGNDVYQFARGDGVDRIDQSDALATDWDTVTFAPGIREDQLWFRQFGAHLEVGVMGGDDRLVLDDWFTDKARAVDAFELSDGQRLLYQQVDVLVQAMAAFAPPAPGQTAWTADQRSAFAPMLAVNPL